LKLNWYVFAFIAWIILMAITIPFSLQNEQLMEWERKHPGYIAGNAIGYLLIILAVFWIGHKLYEKLKPSEKT